MIVLDASVLIAYLIEGDTHHPAADQMISRALDDGRDLLINPITLAEALVVPTREGRVDETIADLEAIGVTQTQFLPDAARALARLRTTTGLKMPDCVVLLTAKDHRAALATFDTQLKQAALENGAAEWQ